MAVQGVRIALFTFSPYYAPRQVAQFLDDCELRDYVSETGLWHPADDSVSCIGGDGPIDHALQSSGDSVGEVRPSKHVFIGEIGHHHPLVIIFTGDAVPTFLFCSPNIQSPPIIQHPNPREHRSRSLLYGIITRVDKTDR